MIGMFAISEIMRFTLTTEQIDADRASRSASCSRAWAADRKYPLQTLRGSVLGTAGRHPARRRAPTSRPGCRYAMSKKLSKEPEKFGTGHLEGLVEAGAANNSALAGAWMPALVFGIPGDSITAIVIGVLYMKNMNPGPTIFLNNPQNVYAVFIVFILANLLMLPLGWACIKASAQHPAHAAQRADADHPDVLHRRRLRHQQRAVRHVR